MVIERPNRYRRYRRWYLVSIQLEIASRSSSRAFQVRRLRALPWRREWNDSITVSSAADATRPMEKNQSMPLRIVFEYFGTKLGPTLSVKIAPRHNTAPSNRISDGVNDECPVTPPTLGYPTMRLEKTSLSPPHTGFPSLCCGVFSVEINPDKVVSNRRAGFSPRTLTVFSQ